MLNATDWSTFMQHTKLPGGNKCSVQVFMSDSSVYLGLLFRNIPTFLVTIEFQREMCSLFKMTQACVLTPSLILSLTAIPLQLLSLCLDFTRCIFKEPTNMEKVGSQLTGQMDALSLSLNPCGAAPAQELRGTDQETGNGLLLQRVEGRSAENCRWQPSAELHQLHVARTLLLISRLKDLQDSSFQRGFRLVPSCSMTDEDLDWFHLAP
ncbi:hypothetical protein H1C71_013536 [Ictidomys tridecemlineatus]|nr:hypothetical protein H1C71_013536 [Ictidomys tridecemlineatus]